MFCCYSVLQRIPWNVSAIPHPTWSWIWPFPTFWRVCVDSLKFTVCLVMENCILFYIFLHTFQCLVPYFWLYIDRYLITVFPLKYKLLVTWKITLAVVIIQWVLSFAQVVIEESYGNSRFGVYFTNAFILIIVAGGVFLYAKTAWVLNRQSQYWENFENQPNNFQIGRLRSQKRFLSTICLVSITTAVCTIPLMVYNISTSSGAVDEHLKRPGSDVVYILLSILFCINFTVNPLLYTWRMRNYRETGRKLFCSG
jgi:hypothetical protein